VGGIGPCSGPLQATQPPPLSLFPPHLLPPHIPSDIIVRGRVRGEGPARAGHLRPAHLYGEVQKSTARAQAREPARTRIPHFDAGVRTAPASAQDVPAALGRPQARRNRGSKFTVG
jgi:hypothetical protein